MGNVIGAKGPETATDMLLEIKQRPDESLKKWIERFMKVKNSILACSDEEALIVAKAYVLRGLRFAFEMRLHPITTYTEYIQKS